MGRTAAVMPFPAQKSSNWKAEIAGTAGSLTVHGFPKIWTARSVWTRCFWILAVILLLSSIFYTFFASYGKYQSKQVYIAKKNQILDQMPFPSVTFCSFLPPLMDATKSMKENASNPSMLFSKSNTSCIFSSIYGCDFNTDFRPIKGFPYCVTFNPDSNFKQTVVGSQFGLQLILFVQDGYSRSLLSGGCGIQVIIHDSDEYPLIPLGRGLYIMSGFETHIVLKVTKKIRKPSPYPSKCVDKLPGDQALFPGRYTTNKCAVDCYFRKLYEHCGNVPNMVRLLINDTKLPVKANATQECHKEATRLFVTSSHRCVCPIQCSDTTYSTRTSATKWGLAPDQVRAMLKEKMGENFTSSAEDMGVRHLAKIVIYFNSFEEETESEEELYDKVGLLSDIGGQLGLLLGASVISLLELFWFLVNAVMVYFYARKKEHEIGSS